jgi:hypothetical protein
MPEEETANAKARLKHPNLDVGAKHKLSLVHASSADVFVRAVFSSFFFIFILLNLFMYLVIKPD